MENTNYNIEVQDAYYVTKDAIIPTKAFKMMCSSGYSPSETVWYLKEKGWDKAAMYEGWREIAWTEEDAKELKKKKMVDHLEYLKKENEKNKQLMEQMEKELNAPKAE